MKSNDNSPTPLCSFRIKPYPKSRYWAEVNVYATLNSMRNGTRKYGEYFKNALALCTPIYDDKHKFAEIRLCIHNSCHRIVTHEIHHAKDFYFSRMPYKQVAVTSSAYDESKTNVIRNSPIERHAYVMGNLTEDFWRKFERKFGNK